MAANRQRAARWTRSRQVVDRTAVSAKRAGGAVVAVGARLARGAVRIPRARRAGLSSHSCRARTAAFAAVAAFGAVAEQDRRRANDIEGAQVRDPADRDAAGCTTAAVGAVPAIAAMSGAATGIAGLRSARAAIAALAATGAVAAIPAIAAAAGRGGTCDEHVLQGERAEIGDGADSTSADRASAAKSAGAGIAAFGAGAAAVGKAAGTVSALAAAAACGALAAAAAVAGGRVGNNGHVVKGQRPEVFDGAGYRNTDDAATAGAAVIAEQADGTGLAWRPAVGTGGARVAGVAVTAVRAVRRRPLEVDIDVGKHGGGAGLDDDRLRRVELHGAESSGAVAEAVDNDIRSGGNDERRADGDAGRIDRLAGSRDIDRRLQGRFGIGAQLHRAAGHHGGIGAKGPKLDRGRRRADRRAGDAVKRTAGECRERRRELRRVLPRHRSWS